MYSIALQHRIDMKKVAVIGFGFMGVTHALNILENEGLQLVAIVDKNPGAIGKGLQPGGNLSTGSIEPEKLKETRTYTALDECLDSEQLDAVHICVHTDLHYGIAKKALSYGLHVLIEKPFCLDIQKGEELIALAKEMDRVLMVGHVVRFMPPYQKLKEWVDNKTYGKLEFLSLSRFSGTPQWGQWKEKQIDFGSSGGALFDFVIHDIDYALYILGKPEKINSYSVPGHLSKHDYVNAILNYPRNNVTVKVEGGNMFHPTFPFRAEYTARFEEATVYYSTLWEDSIFIADDKKETEIAIAKPAEGYYNEINYFAKCIKENHPPLECMPESSLETIKICYKHADGGSYR